MKGIQVVLSFTLLLSSMAVCRADNWSDWRCLAGGLSTAPSVIRGSDGCLQVFALGTDMCPWRIRETAPGGPWSEWERLGGPGEGAPVAAVNTDGRIEMFLQSPGGQSTWHRRQIEPNGRWAEWEMLESLSSYLPRAAALAANGRIVLFAYRPDDFPITKYDKALQSITQVTPGGPNWSGRFTVMTMWFDTRDLAVERAADGRLEVFGRLMNSAVAHTRETAPGSGYWEMESPLTDAQLAAQPVAVGRNHDGRLELFAITSSGDLWHMWQSAPNGDWIPWAPLGGSLADPAHLSAVTGSDGRLHIFAKGSDGGVWHRGQTRPGGPDWSAWESLRGGITGGPTASIDGTGRITVFAKGLEGALWTITEREPEIVIVNPDLPIPILVRRKGDLDGDGKVKIADVIAALRGAVGLTILNAVEIAAADLNGSGRVDLSDVTQILRAAVGLIVL